MTNKERVHQLLCRCGLVPVGTKGWAISRPVPGFVRSEETRPLPVTLRMVKTVLFRVYKLRGAAEVRDILKVHANTAAVEKVKTRDLASVYLAAMSTLENYPRIA
jgi:hypothetical protein